MTDILDDATRRRIILEEQYRQDVRARLDEAKEAAGSSIWKFLNSTLGIWLLSAIFLTGGGALFTRIQAHEAESRLRLEKKLQEEKENRATIERLDIEISHRFSQALLKLNTLSEYQKGRPTSDKEEARQAEAAFDVLFSLRDAPGPSQVPMYPEYARYALPTLISDLQRRLAPKEADDVSNRLARLLGISSRPMIIRPNSAEDAAKIILRDLVLERWQRTAFYFMDCPSENPFC